MVGELREERGERTVLSDFVIELRVFQRTQRGKIGDSFRECEAIQTCFADFYGYVTVDTS